MLSSSSFDTINHYRSQSDTTNVRSPLVHRMSIPRSADTNQVASAAAALEQLRNIRKRPFEDVQFVEKTITSPRNFCYSNNGTAAAGTTAASTATPSNYPATKRAKTEPSSPICYAPNSSFATPHTPKLRLSELPLTPPSAIQSKCSSQCIANTSVPVTLPCIQITQSATPPPSNRSSPGNIQQNRFTTANIPEMQNSAYYYPDTCYSFSLFNTSTATPAINPRAYLLEQQNREWRDYYTYEISRQNSRLYRRYRDYCDGLRQAQSRMSQQQRQTQEPQPINPKPLLPNSSKLTAFINHQYDRYDGLVNYPYANNYNYLASGYMQDVNMLTNSPKLYKTSSSYHSQNGKQGRCKLPPVSQILKMATSPELKTKNLSVPVTTKFINESITSASGNQMNLPSTKQHTHTSKESSSTHSHRIHGSRIHKTIKHCISCHSTQSPCWRPSWAPEKGQLCNSCGLRYKKTKARCINPKCLRIPAKGEWTLMKNRGKVRIPHYNSNGERCGYHVSYKCLHCDGEVVVDE